MMRIFRPERLGFSRIWYSEALATKALSRDGRVADGLIFEVEVEVAGREMVSNTDHPCYREMMRGY